MPTAPNTWDSLAPDATWDSTPSISSRGIYALQTWLINFYNALYRAPSHCSTVPLTHRPPFPP